MQGEGEQERRDHAATLHLQVHRDRTARSNRWEKRDFMDPLGLSFRSTIETVRPERMSPPPAPGAELIAEPYRAGGRNRKARSVLRAFPYNRFRQPNRPEFSCDPDHSGETSSRLW